MKTKKRILWTEGTIPFQQHFQAWDLIWQEEIKQLQHISAPFSYGLFELDLDQSLLSKGVLCIEKVLWALENGECLTVDKTDRELRIRFEHAADKLNNTADIYLCFPKNQAITNLPDYPSHTESAWEATQKVISDNFDQSSNSEVVFKIPQLYLKTDNTSLTHYHAIKIAELINDQGELKLNKKYIPPITHIDASPYLKELVLELYENLVNKASMIHEHRRVFRGSTHELNSIDLAHFMLLEQLNKMLPIFADFKYFSKQAPVNLYTFWCELNAMLSTFTNHYSISDLPTYDHERLSHVFTALAQQTKHLLELAIPSADNGIQLIQESEAIYEAKNINNELLKTHRFFIAVSFSSHDRNWITSFTRQIKIAPRSQIETLISAALAGLSIIHTQHPPQKLMVKAGYEYFYIENQGLLWEKVLQEQNMAIFLPYDFWEAKLELVCLRE